MPKRIVYQKGQRLHPESRLAFICDASDRIEPSGRKVRRAMFVCDCGSTVECNIPAVRKGNTKSCGCYHIDKITKHGFNCHPAYSVWEDMKQRCLNPNNVNYFNYGGRGISICDEWIDSPRDFVSWCLENGWKKGLHLDRIDNQAGYHPANCRFIECKINLRNTRSSKYWFINGVRFDSCRQAARRIGVDGKTIREWCKSGKNNSYSVLKY